MSVDKVLSFSKTITTFKNQFAVSGNTIKITMILTPKHKSIEKLFKENFL